MAWIWVLAGAGAAWIGLAGIARLAGRAAAPLQRLLADFSDRPVRAFAAGALATAALQSSSLFGILLLGLLQGGRLSLRAAAALMLGANLGTTATGFLTAWEPGRLPVLALLLALIYELVRNAQRTHARGKRDGTGWAPSVCSRLSFSFLFLYAGLEGLSAGLASLTGSRFIQRLLLLLGEDAVGGYLAGTLCAALLFSSSLGMALLQRLAAEGGLGLAAALPVLYGLNLGTTADVWLASRWLDREARLLAWLHTGFNLGVGFLFLAVGPHLPVPAAWAALPPAEALAWAHCTFNLAGGLLALPLTRLLPAGPARSR